MCFPDGVQGKLSCVLQLMGDNSPTLVTPGPALSPVDFMGYDFVMSFVAYVVQASYNIAKVRVKVTSKIYMILTRKRDENQSDSVKIGS